jgi:hypothetical protein
MLSIIGLDLLRNGEEWPQFFSPRQYERHLIIGSILSQGAFFGSQSGDRKIPSCTTRDIAAVATKLLLDIAKA